MATEHELKAEVRKMRVLKLICMGGVISLLTVGCAGMKSDGVSAVETVQTAKNIQQPVEKSAPAVVASKTKPKHSAEQSAEQLVASLSKPASEVAVVAQETKPVTVPVQKPVMKVEPKPVSKPVLKVEPKPIPVPVVKVEAAPVPAPVVQEVKAEPVPAPVAVQTPVATPEPKDEAAPESEASTAAIMPAVELVQASDLVAVESNVSAATSKELPIRFDLWRIDKGKGPYDAGVVLITPTFQMGDDRTAAQLYVTVMEDKILITSTSDIAAKKGLSGLRIDEGGWLPFTDVTNDNVGVVRGNWLDKLEKGAKMTIRMGFFPDMSKNPEQFETDISLTDMRTAIPRYKSLLK